MPDTTHPLTLGQRFRHGTVVAFGYYRDDTDLVMSVFCLLDAAHRTPSAENYELLLWDATTDEVEAVQRFANLVEAAAVWADEYGMDI